MITPILLSQVRVLAPYVSKTGKCNHLIHAMKRIELTLHLSAAYLDTLLCS